MENLINGGGFLLILLAGYLLKRSDLLRVQDSNLLNTILFRLTLPCAALHAFACASVTASDLCIIAIGALCAGLPILASRLLLRRSSKKEWASFACNAAGFNTGCFSLPYVQTMMGAQAAAVVCLVDIGNAFVTNGAQYAIVQNLCTERRTSPVRRIVKDLLSSLAFDVYLVLTICALAGLTIPEPLLKLTQAPARANSTIAFLSIGLQLNLRCDRSQLRFAAGILAFRLAAAALFSAGVFFLLPVDPFVKKALIVVLFSPIPTLGTVYATMVGVNEEAAGFANTVSILISMVLMPLLFRLLPG